MLFPSINFEQLFDKSTDMICIVGLDGNFRKLNKAFQRLLNLPLEQLIGTPFLNYIHPEDIEKSKEKVQQFIKGAIEIKHFDNRYLSRNGEYRWLRWSSISLISNEFIFGIAHDVTENKRNELRLEESNNWLNKIINLVPHPIFIKDNFGKYILVNQAQADLFSLVPEMLMGKDDSLLVKDLSELEVISNSDKHVLENKESVILPNQFVTYKGITRILHTTKIPIVSPVDKGISILGVSIDITEIKNNENELKKINFELDNFVYRSSHDLRAPLKSVLGLLDLMKIETEPSLMHHYIERAKKSIQTLDNFIFDLTNFSRNSRLEVQNTKIDFYRIYTFCVDNLSYMENAQKIHFDFKIIGEADFYSDESRIKILFMNFISNSIKYQNIEQEKPYLGILLNIKKEHVIITFKDNGLGIEEKYQEKIYDMFFRASEQSFGSGLGLYIVKQTIEKLEGSIKVNSTPFVGTEFTIVLPNKIMID